MELQDFFDAADTSVQARRSHALTKGVAWEIRWETQLDYVREVQRWHGDRFDVERVADALQKHGVDYELYDQRGQRAERGWRAKYDVWGFRAKRKYPYADVLLGQYETREEAEAARSQIDLKEYTSVVIEERYYKVGA